MICNSLLDKFYDFSSHFSTSQLTCEMSEFYGMLPEALRYPILTSDWQHTTCVSAYSMLLSGVLVLFIISVTRISHIIHIILIIPITAAYTVIIAYTHQELFTTHDTIFRYSSIAIDKDFSNTLCIGLI